MRVLVTGNLGYIGPFVIKYLRERGHTTIGCDLDIFHEARTEKFDPPDIQWLKDFCTINQADLSGVECIIHLAGISNDPMGELDTALTGSINFAGSARLANMAKQAGVSRFLFSSSCSIYGKSSDRPVKETDSLNPLTAYATSKIQMEEYLVSLADKGFTTASLRNSTAFGYSPVFRTDLVVNNLLASAITQKKIIIKSDGLPWRPYLHCSDIARAFISFTECESGLINKQAINIGANNLNYQVNDIAETVRELVPDAEIIYSGEVGEDPRNYRVCFDKLNSLFPEYMPEYDLRAGMYELKEKLEALHFSAEDFKSDRGSRLLLLKKNLHKLKP